VSVFGSYDYSFSFDSDEITISIEESENFFKYVRICGSDRVEKMLMSCTESACLGKMIVNPVEPVNLPKEITRYLEITFTPLIIEPNSQKVVFIKFPVEIGIFLEAKNDYTVLDIFSLTWPKYSLYGPPSGGVITRLYSSDVFSSVPDMDRRREGIILLTVKNTTNAWIDVSRIVINSLSIQIYYNGIVSMVAEMEILSKNIASVKVLNKPLYDGMQKSIELYRAKKIPGIDEGTYFMEFGLR
jgi:hypothetical protein